MTSPQTDHFHIHPTTVCKHDLVFATMFFMAN